MCFLWAYYYPATGERVCLQTGDYVGCCPGDDLLCDIIADQYAYQ